MTESAAGPTTEPDDGERARELLGAAACQIGVLLPVAVMFFFQEFQVNRPLAVLPLVPASLVLLLAAGAARAIGTWGRRPPLSATRTAVAVALSVVVVVGGVAGAHVQRTYGEVRVHRGPPAPGGAISAAITDLTSRRATAAFLALAVAVAGWQALGMGGRERRWRQTIAVVAGASLTMVLRAGDRELVPIALDLLQGSAIGLAIALGAIAADELEFGIRRHLPDEEDEERD